MIILKEFSNSPLRFLFYLNWILLGILLLSILPLGHSPINSSNWFVLVCLAIFGLMGFKLGDLKKPRDKIIYIFLEIFLIELTNWGGTIGYVVLYIVLVARNSFFLSSSTRFKMTVAVLILFIQGQFNRMPHHGIFEVVPIEDRLKFAATTIVLFGIVIFFLHLLVDTVLAEYQSRKKLAIANEKLRQYAAKIEDIAILQERNRIAREIHDSLGHSLTVFNLHLEAVLRLLPPRVPTEAIELLKEAQEIGKTALKEVHESVIILRSQPLEGKSLQNAIEELIEDLKRSTGIVPQYNINVSTPVSEDIKITTYRILQEAITNICKYSRATEVTVNIEANTELKLTVEDNGIGFNLEENSTGFGLQGMRERAESNGGYCTIITAPDRGCKISVSLPLSLVTI